jgi:hypothetical protein
MPSLLQNPDVRGLAVDVQALRRKYESLACVPGQVSLAVSQAPSSSRGGGAWRILDSIRTELGLRAGDGLSHMMPEA